MDSKEVKARSFVVEIKSVIGNRVANQDGVAGVYFTNQQADKLTYCAPCNGDFIRAFAFMADTMEDAERQALEWLLNKKQKTE